MTLALAFSLGAMAQNNDQDHKSPAERADKRTTEMTADLGLNADQQAKVATINLQYATAMKDVRTITDQTAQDYRADILKGNRDNAYQEVLTAEQYQKMLTMRAEKKAKHDEKKHNE